MSNEKKIKLTELEEALLEKIQHNFPIVERPFDELGAQLGLSGEKTIELLKKLKSEGIIRLIGGVFDPRKLGFKGTLIGLKVDKNHIDKIVERINKCHGVSHNYLRDHEYNLWFTLIMPSKEEIDAFIEELRKEDGVISLIELPAKRIFKIDVRFKIKD
ncbi:transcriptional regulator, AsnC family [Thermodesulfobium acidiphilum]|uniref:siroheme decarboxylase n=1 Tax=Thermodesulfobium acidiphilum TaxID=1794699 RepID=A0A2R4W146_THEAF|nr:Lrp/AsnC family transcriptional regulator [Thermodesulfobium acidiphilum]AWB10531.1 transcriptional regulator, AsnC family [Thermodesulfobium acidiphilum]